MHEPQIPLIDEEGEVRELTAADQRLFRPAREVLPLDFQRELGMRPLRAPQSKPPRELATLLLDSEVLRSFKAQGKGWQERINAVLREAVATNR